MLKKPSQFGFLREVAEGEREDKLDEVGNVVKGKQRIDIYYIPPVGKRLRSLREAEEYLSKHQHEDLSVKNFNFSKKILGLGDQFEKVRQTVAMKPREKKTSKKNEASRNQLQPAEEIGEKKPSDSGNPKIMLDISCEELNKQTKNRVKKGKLLGKLMRKFSEKVDLEGPDQLVFSCEGKILKETDSVDSLSSTKIDVKLAERGN